MGSLSLTHTIPNPCEWPFIFLFPHRPTHTVQKVQETVSHVEKTELGPELVQLHQTFTERSTWAKELLACVEKLVQPNMGRYMCIFVTRITPSLSMHVFRVAARHFQLLWDCRAGEGCFEQVELMLAACQRGGMHAVCMDALNTPHCHTINVDGIRFRGLCASGR